MLHVYNYKYSINKLGISVNLCNQNVSSFYLIFNKINKIIKGIVFMIT